MVARVTRLVRHMGRAAEGSRTPGPDLASPLFNHLIGAADIAEPLAPNANPSWPSRDN